MAERPASHTCLYDMKKFRKGESYPVLATRVIEQDGAKMLQLLVHEDASLQYLIKGVWVDAGLFDYPVPEGLLHD